LEADEKDRVYGYRLCGWDVGGNDSGFVQWQALVLDVLKPLGLLPQIWLILELMLISLWEPCYITSVVRRIPAAWCRYLPNTLSPPNKFLSWTLPFPTVKSILRVLNLGNLYPFLSSSSPSSATWALHSAEQRDT